jgi:hypothetical protein
VPGRIHVVRGVRVVLDADLAALYGVSTTRLNEAMRRNRARFPEDFMFQLTSREHENLRSQIAISNRENMRSQSATSSNEDLAKQVDGHDELFAEIFAALHALSQPPPATSRRIGFRPPS